MDCVNTATGIAYQDIYKTSRQAWQALRAKADDLREPLEMLLATDYVPQLIRHVQVLYQSMVRAGTGAYIKIGTSGTGGMGLNIPYTHSEEKPSRVLLSKSALAGRAHAAALPDGAHAGRADHQGDQAGGGHRLEAHRLRRDRCAAAARSSSTTPASPRRCARRSRFRPLDPAQGHSTGQTLHSVFIDTGENGIFSLEEFSAITTGEQMEFVTPEEIADVVVRELMGGNTGHDVINALDNAVMGPTYRAGMMRHWALEKLLALEREHGVHSVAFENLGPPRLSKLLFEGDLLRRCYRHDGGGARGRARRPVAPAGARSSRATAPTRARSCPSASRSCSRTAACCAGRSARSRRRCPARTSRRSRPSAWRRGPGRAGWTCARAT